MFAINCCQKAKAVNSLAFIFFTIACLPVQADIVFTAPPRENPDTAKELYQPIAEKLSSILGENVIVFTDFAYFFFY